MRRVRLVVIVCSIVASISSPATTVASRAETLRVPVLVMHHVKWDRPGDNATELGLTIHPTQFRQELTYLATHRYRTVTASRVLHVLTHGWTLAPHPVVLTFDDGYADMFTTVYPLLRSAHMVATFFVCPGLLDHPRYLTWSQLQIMARHGMDIEAHTLTHPDLRVVPKSQARAEIVGSRTVLQRRLRVRASVFAYPYGSFNAAVLAEVRQAGYLGAFTTEQGWNLSRQSRFLLPRVYVDRDDSLTQFAARLSGNLSLIGQDPT